MIVGIYAEGRGDLAVITNILKGVLNIDRADLRYELPEYELDQTDLSVMPEQQQSSWTVVKKICRERAKINRFFESPIEQESFIVIQLDTAERGRGDYNVTEPVKNTDTNSKAYCNQLRITVIRKVNEWLENAHPGKIAYAITIEETDAWVLTIYESGGTDTSTHQNPKEKLNRILNRILKPNEKPVLKAKAFDKYDWLSSGFRRRKKLVTHMAKNESLKLFCESLEAFKEKDDQL